MQDLVGGRIDFLCEIIATAKPQIDGGKVKGIAIMTKERSPVLPNLAPTREQGLDVQAYTWSALFLPKGAPADVVKKLNEAAIGAIETPSVQERCEAWRDSRGAERAQPAMAGRFRQERSQEVGGADQGQRRPGRVRRMPRWLCPGA